MWRIWWLRDFLRDARRLGWGFACSAARSDNGTARTIRLRRGPTVHFRPGTTDTPTIRSIFGFDQFGNQWATSTRLLREWYDEIVGAGRVPLIIDAGANIGAASLWFVEQFPAARLVAVEPEPENAALCRANLGERGEVRQEAIGAERGFAKILDDHVDVDAFQVKRAPSGMPICTIQSILADAGDAELFVVKVDIEGFEADLFSANTEWIDRAKVVIIEPHDWMMPDQGTSFAFQRVMGASGLELHISGENLVYVRPRGQREVVRVGA